MSAILHFEVIGRLWNGGLGSYQYSDLKAPDEPCSRTEARAIRDAIVSGQARGSGVPDMGDFAEICDCRIIHETNAYEKAGGMLRRVDTFRTLAGFKEPGNAARYARWTYR